MVSGFEAGISVVESREQVKNLISDSWNRYLIPSPCTLRSGTKGKRSK